MNNQTQVELMKVQHDSELVLGCQYRTPWQDEGSNNLILVDFKSRGKKEPKVKSVQLMSRASKKTLWTSVKGLMLVSSVSNTNRLKDISRLGQAKHRPTKIGEYMDLSDKSVWEVIDTSDLGRPKMRSLEDGHIKAKSLGNFLSEYQYQGDPNEY